MSVCWQNAQRPMSASEFWFRGTTSFQTLRCRDTTHWDQHENHCFEVAQLWRLWKEIKTLDIDIDVHVTYTRRPNKKPDEQRAMISFCSQKSCSFAGNIGERLFPGSEIHNWTNQKDWCLHSLRFDNVFLGRAWTFFLVHEIFFFFFFFFFGGENPAFCMHEGEKSACKDFLQNLSFFPALLPVVGLLVMFLLGTGYIWVNFFAESTKQHICDAVRKRIPWLRRARPVEANEANEDDNSADDDDNDTDETDRCVREKED